MPDKLLKYSVIYRELEELAEDPVSIFLRKSSKQLDEIRLLREAIFEMEPQFRGFAAST
jgi:hypothetical protein